MNFLKTIQNSIYSKEFYSTLLKKSFKSSIYYFLLLILLLTAIRVVTLVNPLFVQAPAALQSFASQIVDCFPKDLEVKITNGQTSTNAKEPYFISSCGTTNKQNLVVIDTKTPYSPEKFDEYKVEAWVTKNSIISKRNNVETRSYNLTQIKDFKLNKDSLKSFSNMLTPYLKFVGPILILLAFLGIYLSYIFRLIHLLIVAALILVLGKIFKKDLGFGESYKLGLYAITLGLIVDLVVSLTSRWTYLYGFPFMVTILTLAVVLINFLLPKKAS